MHDTTGSAPRASGAHASTICAATASGATAAARQIATSRCSAVIACRSTRRRRARCPPSSIAPVGDHRVVTRLADRDVRDGDRTGFPRQEADAAIVEPRVATPSCGRPPRSITTPLSQCSASWRSITFPCAPALHVHRPHHAPRPDSTVRPCRERRERGSPTTVSRSGCARSARPSVTAIRIAQRSSRHSFSATT